MRFKTKKAGGFPAFFIPCSIPPLRRYVLPVTVFATFTTFTVFTALRPFNAG
jgi:hypothetical protein